MKTTGILGILALLCFGIGFEIFFIFLNRGYFDISASIFIVGYNRNGANGLVWMKYFNYLFTGILITIFFIRLIKLHDNSGFSLAGSIFLLLSGIIWTSFGLVKIFPKSDISIYILVIRIWVALTLCSIGFILIAADYSKIVRDIKINWSLLIIGSLILLNGLSALVFNNYHDKLKGLSWLLYFIGIGNIGYTLLKKASTQHRLISNAGETDK